MGDQTTGQAGTDTAQATKHVYKAGDEYLLKYPLEDIGLASVTLRRLNGKDLVAIADAADKGKGSAARVLACRCASIPPSTFDQLDAEDATALGEIAAGFIGGALATGET